MTVAVTVPLERERSRTTWTRMQTHIHKQTHPRGVAHTHKHTRTHTHTSRMDTVAHIHATRERRGGIRQLGRRENKIRGTNRETMKYDLHRSAGTQ